MKTFDILEKAIQELEKEPTIINDYDGDYAHLDMDKDLILRALKLGSLYTHLVAHLEEKSRIKRLFYTFEVDELAGFEGALDGLYDLDKRIEELKEEIREIKNE